MKERPILFSDEMVRAILDGRKSQTRRVITPLPMTSWIGVPILNEDERCPHGQPGDWLWVREAFALVPCSAGCEKYPEGFDPTKSSVSQPAAPHHGVRYRATWDRSRCAPWKPSIHMPRWASRSTLEITGVRVERVGDISEADARAEGAPVAYERRVYPSALAAKVETYRQGFAEVWDRINGKRPGYTWSENPWVWVIEFKRIS
jgi:hypothetical protein